MVDRILIRGGASPRFRISKPGKDVASGNYDDFLIREDVEPMRPSFHGSVIFGGVATIDVGLSPIPSGTPFVLLKSNDGLTPSVNEYYAELSIDRSTLRIRNNRAVGRTIQYFVFLNTF